MHRDPAKLRDDALRIWRAGVEAVKPSVLLPQFVATDDKILQIGELEFNLRDIERIAIVGAGKAGAGMAVALEEMLGEKILREKHVTGWINVPADCVVPTKVVTPHPARPASVNEPTIAGVRGTEVILELVSTLGPRDLCLCLLSGGGSALLPAPANGLFLETKIALTREIAARGGTIEQLNTVRRELSRVKGGGLARACRAGHLVTLILSDVLGDDLETIASGPTILRKPTPERAIAVLCELNLENHPVGQEAIEFLRSKENLEAAESNPCEVTNIVIGNNATAVDAAGIEAERLGYSHAMISAQKSEGPVSSVATQIAQAAESMRRTEGPDCLISGGEPTVELCDSAERGLGGRNQQLALDVLSRIFDWREIAFVSGGTDGEDGPTDAAGAFVDVEIAAAANKRQLDAADYLQRNDAYHFFENVGGLIRTGPTHTNVCDIRVVTVGR